MFWIEKLAADRYRITDGFDRYDFGREKLEALYSAVPPPATQFYRLLTEELVDNEDERKLMNRIIDRAGDREYNIDVLQEEIKKLPAP